MAGAPPRPQGAAALTQARHRGAYATWLAHHRNAELAGKPFRFHLRRALGDALRNETYDDLAQTAESLYPPRGEWPEISEAVNFPIKQNQ
jgi:hypothetical protein